MKEKPTNIFIAECIPALNKGEMTILEGMLESFKPIGNPRVSLLSDMPEIDKPRYEPGVKIIDIQKHLFLTGSQRHHNLAAKLVDSSLLLTKHIVFSISYKLFGNRALRVFKSEIWHTIADADVILIGHNGCFGMGGGLGSPVLFYPVFMPFLAKFLKKPIMIYGGSIFKIKNVAFPFRLWLTSALKAMDSITLREENSEHNLIEIRYKSNNTRVTADPACLLKPTEEKRIAEILRLEGLIKNQKPLIGFTVTEKVARKAYPQLPGQQSYQRHIEDLARTIDYLTQTIDAQVVFLPHCIGFARNLDDRVIAKKIYDLCQNKANVKVIINEYSAAELKGLIGQCDLFVGERIHSVINAMTSHVPSIVIDMRSDMRLGIIRMIGQAKAIFYVENQNSSLLAEKILETWENRAEIRRNLVNQSTLIVEKAMSNGTILKNIVNDYKNKTAKQ